MSRRRMGLRAQMRLWSYLSRECRRQAAPVPVVRTRRVVLELDQPAPADAIVALNSVDKPAEPCACRPGDCPDKPALGWPHGLGRWQREGRTGWTP